MKNEFLNIIVIWANYNNLQFCTIIYTFLEIIPVGNDAVRIYYTRCERERERMVSETSLTQETSLWPSTKDLQTCYKHFKTNSRGKLLPLLFILKCL